MSNGLVLVKNETMAKVYSLNFHLYTDMNCLHSTGTGCVEQFKTLIPFLDVLIIDSTINGDNIVEQLDALFVEQNISIPTIVLSRLEVETENDCFYYLKDLSVKSIIKQVGKVLDITAQDMVSKIVPEKVPLHINYFKDFNTAPCDIFLREINEESEYTYHQLFEKGEAVKGQDIAKIQKDERKNKLYIPKLERLKFVNYYTSQLMTSDKSSVKKSKEEIQSFLQMSRDNIASIIKDQNGMDEIMDIADESITGCLKDIESQGDPKLLSFITDLVKSTDSYYLQQAQLSSYISFKLLKGLNWLSMSQKKTFVSASFFQYILLDSNQEDLAKIRDEDTLGDLKSQDKITSAEYITVKSLPLMTARLLGSCKNQTFPENTLTVIREQNGNKSGSGFIVEDEKSLHSLSIAFIIANTYADKVLLEGLDDHDVIITELERDFAGKKKFLSYIQLLHVDSQGNKAA